jgi:O-antigen biosynthesis protein WbqP
LIKLEAPRERVIFSQERIGKNGKAFRIYKFRSMKSSAPSELSTAEFLDAERYITRIGKLLRKTSLDELPQLWNVLRGDMSIIGEGCIIGTTRKTLDLARVLTA